MLLGNKYYTYRIVPNEQISVNHYLKMKQLLILGLIFGLTSCSVNENKLVDNKTFRGAFSTTEIQDLQLMFDFFNQSICSDLETQDLTECYQDFFKRMEQSIETGDIQLAIPFDQQQAVYEQLSDSTFFEIWEYRMSYRQKEAPLDTFRVVDFALGGNYFNFLREVGKSYRVVNKYYQSIIAAGCIPPAIGVEFLVNHDYYNIDDLRVKFMVAIHYLTLNDRSKRKEKINKGID